MGVNKSGQIPQMFHVKHFAQLLPKPSLFHVNHSFSNAELRENNVQNFFNVNVASNTSEIL